MQPHLMIHALAGTGKTTTLVEGVKRFRLVHSTLKPSKQQAQIWKSFGIGTDSSAVCFAAFSNHIKQAMELQIGGSLITRKKANCDVLTFHGMGYRAIRNTVGIRGEMCRLEKNKTRKIISILHDDESTYSLNRRWPGFVPAVCKLVRYSKYMGYLYPSNEQLTLLAANYGVQLDSTSNRIFDTTRDVLIESLRNVNEIDFDDMPWMPIVGKMKIRKYSMLMVDEGQDLNYIQQQLALKAGDRIIITGDNHQAIYAWAGADSESLNTMYSMLRQREDRPIVELPLTISWRCSQAVAEVARMIVPEFEAHSSNEEGFVTTAGSPANMNVGDMGLCRTNAPLVSIAFQIAERMLPVEIIGQDIKSSLVDFVKSSNANTLEDLARHINRQEKSEVSYLKELGDRKSRMAIAAVQDKFACLRRICMEATTINHVLEMIQTIFTDEPENPKEPPTKIRLSSIHRAKGLEADNVFIFRPDLLPHPLAKSDWEVGQERNLKYVAITRAKRSLTWVTE